MYKICNPSHGHHGPGEEVKVADEGNKISGGDITQDSQSAPQPDDNRKANIGKNDHHGKEEGKGFGQPHVYGDIPLSFLLYILMCPGLPVIGLDNPDSGKYFTGSLGEISKRLLSILKTGRHAPCENPGEYNYDGCGDKCNKG